MQYPSTNKLMIVYLLNDKERVYAGLQRAPMHTLIAGPLALCKLEKQGMSRRPFPTPDGQVVLYGCGGEAQDEHKDYEN